MRSGPPTCLLPIVLGGAACGPGADAPLDRPNYTRPTPDGTVLVSDLLNARVVRYDAQGRAIDAIGDRGHDEDELWRVHGLAVRDDGSFAVVNHGFSDPDDPSTRSHTAKVFDADGDFIRSFSLTPPGEPEGWPSDLTATDTGWIVSDPGRNLIMFYNHDGRVLRRIDRLTRREQGSASSTVIRPPPLEGARITMFDGECLWLVENSEHRVRCVTLAGEELYRFGTEGTAPGELLFPMAATASKAGWVAVADLGNHRVQRFTKEGVFIDMIEPEPSGPRAPPSILDLGLGADDSLWITDSKGNRVLHWTEADGLRVAIGGKAPG